MLFILTRLWHNFKTRNVRMCLWPVLAWCPLTDTKSVSQCSSNGQKRDVASDVKYIWCRHNQTNVTIIKTRQSAMAKGNWMSQSARTFNRGVNTPDGFAICWLGLFLQTWSLIPEVVTLAHLRPDLLSWKVMALTRVRPFPHLGRQWCWHTSDLIPRRRNCAL